MNRQWAGVKSWLRKPSIARVLQPYGNDSGGMVLGNCCDALQQSCPIPTYNDLLSYEHALPHLFCASLRTTDVPSCCLQPSLLLPLLLLWMLMLMTLQLP